MRNIPTELLRAMVTVADLGSYTKAAEAFGLTQPAVSGQLRRLQELIGGELFERTTPGVHLTELGQLVVNDARRLLSINDRLLELVSQRASSKAVHLGFPGDYGQATLASVIVEERRRSPHRRFVVRSDNSDNLLRRLRHGDLDLVVAFTESGETPDALSQWPEEIAWIRGRDTNLDLARPVPLVAYYDTAVFNRVAATSLAQAGLDWELAVVVPNTLTIGAIVAAGLGVAVTPRRFIPPGLTAWDDGPLPRPRDVFCGVYMRDTADSELLAKVAEAIAQGLRRQA